MNYNEIIDYIYNSAKFKSKSGYENAKELLGRMNNPQNKFKTIHIAGTNGKGSVASMLAHILYKNGYRVGLFTSPHLKDFTERIRLNLAQIPKKEVMRIFPIVKSHIDDMIADGHYHPRWFEIITAIGFQYFAEANVDFAIVEVGLGGRMDATNILEPILSIITPISYDHVNILGDNIKDIAYEKAGIIKRGIPVVMYPQEDDAKRVIEDTARDKDSYVYMVESANIKIISSRFERQIFNFKYKEFSLRELSICLPGRHQILNAATALMSIFALKQMGIDIDNNAIFEGLESTRWPGRLERLKTDPDMIVDGAHNASSAMTLARAITDYYNDRSLVLVIGLLRDKEVNKILGILCPLANYVIVTKPDSHRAMDVESLAQMAKPYSRKVIIVEDIKEAIKKASYLAGPEGVAIFSGSLYLVGEVRDLISSLRY
ncbi:MAG: bifunctional folylpolyglutamate synthase/dihydrofolate synthase [Clostridiales bacterium]|nr:bifunctional folylpolyglutamate synthase/dihydrofolate synthase [Clostridiales bacterium]